VRSPSRAIRMMVRTKGLPENRHLETDPRAFRGYPVTVNHACETDFAVKVASEIGVPARPTETSGSSWPRRISRSCWAPAST
jgi:hypothetical protein